MLAAVERRARPAVVGRVVLASCAAAVVALCLSAWPAAATCPNACSGNGVCNHRDFCECEHPYHGNDCSLRECPLGLAWADTPRGDFDHDNSLRNGGNDYTLAGYGNRPAGTIDNTAITPMWRPEGIWERHPSQLYGTVDDFNVAGNMPMYVRKQEGHFYMPCSNNGICDETRGICVCFEGFEGAACNRTSCYNDCSNHGRCLPIGSVAPDDTEYRLWDQSINRGCLCDPGWEGPDCSQRICPGNDDPLTEVTTTRGVSENIPERDEIQRIRIKCANDGGIDESSTIRLAYTDPWFGSRHETDKINVGSTDDQSAAILEALRGLPNQVLASQPEWDRVVAVTRSILQDGRGNAYYYYWVTFSHQLGNVAPLEIITDGMVCKAGIVLEDGYRSAAWVENVHFSYPTHHSGRLGPTVDTTLTLEVVDVASDPEQFSYALQVDGGPAATIDTDKAFDFFTGPDYLDPAIRDLFPMLVSFPEGGAGADDFRGLVGDQYTVKFTAGAPDCEVETRAWQTSTVLPITYGLERITGGVAELLFIEYSDPNDVPDSSVVATVTVADVTGDPDTMDWSTTDGDSLTGVDMHDGWSTLAGATSDMDIYKIKVAFEFGSNDAAQRTADGAQWRFNAEPGYISGDGNSGNDEDVALRDAAAVAYEAYDRVHIEITLVAKNFAEDAVQGGGANTDVYSYTYNGVEMGVYRVMDTWQTLGNTQMGRPTDTQTFQIKFGREVKVSASRSVGDTWRFALIKEPIQASWGYQETFRAHYFHNDISSLDARLFTPTSDMLFTLVINILETSDTDDAYRWKLSHEEEWQGSADSPLTFALGTTSTTGANTATWRPDGLVTPGKHDRVNNLALYLSGTSLLDVSSRSCDPDDSNSYYYLSLGDDGVNDVPECSARGICNRKKGVCECFNHYAGSDCHLQAQIHF